MCCCAPADPTDKKNPKYKCARGGACCGSVNEIIAILIVGALQVMVWTTVSLNCKKDDGRVRTVADWITPDVEKELVSLRNRCDELDRYSYLTEELKTTCLEIWRTADDLLYGAQHFCNMEGVTGAMTFVSILFAITLTLLSLMTCLKACTSCCGRKCKHLSLAIVSIVGFIVSIITAVFAIVLYGAYNRYSYGYWNWKNNYGTGIGQWGMVPGIAQYVAPYTLTLQNTIDLPGKEPYEGSFGNLLGVLLICIFSWQFYLAIYRFVQMILSSCACCAKFEEDQKEVITVQIA